MSEFGEPLERQQVNVRLDPSLHMIMKGAKEIVGASSMDEVYTMAIEEFLASHPEIVDGVHSSIVDSQSVAVSALQRLQQIREQRDS